MKKVLLTAALVALMAGTSFATISGSAHDLVAAGYTSPNNQLCIFCHTPHNADTTVNNAPLWNHEVSSATYTPYDNTASTQNSAAGVPTGVSLLCLSCHDGTVGITSFGATTGTVDYIPGTANLDIDLSDDHPVGILYDTALATADGNLEDPATNATVAGMLFAGNLECSSCHDVHDDAGNVSLLVIDNAGSALCTTCHQK